MARDPFVCRSVHLLLGLLFLFSAWFAQAQQPDLFPYQDPDLPFSERVDDLLSRMTLEEKVSQMMSRTPHDLPRFGIPGYPWSGLSAHCVGKGNVNTVFPHAIAQAATWDPALADSIGAAVSAEARAFFNSRYPGIGLTFWAPVVELARDPRWGRTHECYGEDPLLTAAVAGAWVRGVQGNDPHYLRAIAAPKHFVANNEEWDRHNGSSNINEELLREYYLKPYKILVKDDHAMGIMAAYNSLNGVPCIANRWLLTGVLRREWGFPGTVVTDCNGIKDLFEGHRWVANEREAITAAVNAGIDIECGDYFKENLLYLAQHNIVTEAAIDTAVRRILLSRFMLGLYDPPERVSYNRIPMDVVDSPEHRVLARLVAQEAIILLKNEGDLLPLDKKNTGTVAVIGPLADKALLGGYTGKYSHAVSPLEGLREALGAKRVIYEKGTGVKITLPPVPARLLEPPSGKGHGLLGEYFGDTSFSGKPVFTRIDSIIDFNFGKGSPGEGVPKQYYAVRWTGRFISPVSGIYYIGGDFDDILRLWLDGRKIIDRSKNRNRSSVAVKVVLVKGRAYDLRLEFVQLWYKGRVRLWGGVPDPHKFDKAVAAARRADVAVVVAGIDDSVEGEGRDRSSLALPGDQADLVMAVLNANPRTVLVLQNGGPVSIPRLAGEVPAIVETFCNGEEGGHALADVLLGDHNPAGRLPLTIYRSVKQLPDISDYDIRKGRTYMYYSKLAGLDPAEPEPLYVFGHGLSYTKFTYGRMQILPDGYGPYDTVRVAVEVRNSGRRDGEEVVQLYARVTDVPVTRPDQQLVAFRRIPLKAGERRRINLSFPVKALAYWDTVKNEFVTPRGKVVLRVGASSADIRDEQILDLSEKIKGLARQPRHGNTYVIAHRGAHRGIPENTLAAYRKAIELGCDFVEIDVRRTKDGRFVSLHNSTVDKYVPGMHGRVGDFTLAELKKMDIGSRVGPEWKDERIPTLEEILELCRGKIGIYLDLKEPYVKEISAIIRKYGMEQDVVWYIPATRMDVILELQKVCPACIPMPDPGPARNIPAVAEKAHPQVLATDMGELNEKYIQLAHERGIMVFVDEDKGGEKEWQKILKLGTDGIQTDEPEKLIRKLE